MVALKANAKRNRFITTGEFIQQNPINNKKEEAPIISWWINGALTRSME
jgi:hypothetical protein